MRPPGQPRDPRAGWRSRILRLLVLALLLAVVLVLLVGILASR